MKGKSRPSIDTPGALRQRAEKALRQQPEVPEKMASAEMRELIHELQVHQIELEIQNEELRRAQLELEESRNKYSDLYDYAPVGYFTLSETNIILEANLTAAAMLGVTRSSLIKKPLTRFIERQGQDTFYLFRNRLFETETQQTCELKMVGPGRSTFDGLMEAMKAYGADGKLVYRLSLSDITARKIVEEKLKQYSEKLEEMVAARTGELREALEKLVRQEKLAVVGQLAAGVGHELRNPLCNINNAVYFLRLIQPGASEKVREYLDIIEDEAHNADRIVIDLLGFTGSQSADRQPVQAADLVGHVLRHFAVPENVLVTLDLPGDLPNSYVDVRQAQQVLANLVTNACQAMPGGGRLTLSARFDGQMVAIAVVDSGVGISPENKCKLFEPLFTTKARGMGLGLAVSKKLAEANEGRIDVQSTLGAGSTFTLYLPVAKPG